MNENKWLFIGEDKRLAICSDLMAERGYECRSIKTDEYTAELEAELIDFAPGNIVFPILEMSGTIPIELLEKNTVLFTGVASEEWLASFIENDLIIQH